MPRRTPAHHFRRGNIFYFRLAIPADLREHFPTRELCLSLSTERSQLAYQQSIQLSAIMLSLFTQLREQSMTKEKSSALIEMVRNAADKLRRQARQEERENTLIDHLAAAHKARKAEAAKHAQEIENHQKLHVATVAEMAAHHAKATAELAMRAEVSATPAATPAPPESAMLISEVAEYVKRTKIMANKWTEKTAGEYMVAARLLIEIIGNKPAGAVSFPDVAKFIETLKKIPPNINKNKKYKGKTLDQIIAMGDESISPRTVEKHIERISTIFKSAMEPKHSKETGVTLNVFEGESIAADAPGKDETTRLPFSDDDIQNLFNGEEVRKRAFNNPYHYWLMPMGLLTGARLNELCQLWLDDFVLMDGVWCLDINDSEEGKRVKTKRAKRLVPIHDALIQLGIIEYCNALRAAGFDRFFPELSRGRDGYGQKASDWFGRHRQKCGITGKQTKVFHSFRHTFITRLIDDEVTPALIAPIVGHEGRLITERVYFNTGNAKRRKETVIDKIIHFNNILENYPKVHEVTLKVNRKDNFWRNGILIARASAKQSK